MSTCVWCCAVLSRSVVSLCDPKDYIQPARLLCPWDSPAKNTEVFPCPPPGDLPHPGIKPGSLTLQADSLPSEPPGKPDKYPTCL